MRLAYDSLTTLLRLSYHPVATFLPGSTLLRLSCDSRIPLFLSVSRFCRATWPGSKTFRSTATKRISSDSLKNLLPPSCDFLTSYDSLTTLIRLSYASVSTLLRLCFYLFPGSAVQHGAHDRAPSPLTRRKPHADASFGPQRARSTPIRGNL